MKLAIALSAGAMMTIAGSALAVEIASQDFNGLDDSGTFTLDAFVGSGTLTNSGASNAGGGGMDFVTNWFETRGTTGPNDGNEGSDFIGVNSFSGNNSPDVGPTGVAVASGVEHNYEFNDGDGRLELTFAAVDASGYTDVEVSFNYWITDTTWESNDFFSATLSDGVGSVSIFNWGELSLEANVSPDDGSNNWGLMSISNVETLGLDMSNLILTISVDNNSGAENIFVDSISINGIPSPGAFALLGVAGLAGLRRRR